MFNLGARIRPCRGQPEFFFFQSISGSFKNRIPRYRANACYLEFSIFEFSISDEPRSSNSTMLGVTRGFYFLTDSGGSNSNMPKIEELG